MEFRTLLYRTEAIIYRHTSRIIERDGYRVIDTPDRRGWYWGNYLLFDAPPRVGDLDRWRGIFAREFDDPKVQHMVFAWDDPNGDHGLIDPFLEAGFELERSVTLATSDVHPSPKHNDGIVVREVTLPEELDQWSEISIDSGPPRFPRETFSGFVRAWTDRYRRMSEAGAGTIYGAFMGDRLVGGLGLYFDGTVGRFQRVCTALDARRRGVCGTLVYEASRRALESGRATTLVMVADEEYHAARIYESVGFRGVEHTVALVRYPERPVPPTEPVPSTENRETP